MNAHSSRFLPLVLLSGGLAIAGCSHKYSDDSSLDPSGVASELVGAIPGDGDTDARTGRLFFPLAQGNRWEYHVRTRNQFTIDGQSQPPMIQSGTQVDEITGTQAVGDRTYFVETETVSEPGTVTLQNQFMLRESRFGLFELQALNHAEGSAVEPPADAVTPSLAAYIEQHVPDARARVAFDRAAAQVTQKLAAIQQGLHDLRRHPRGADPDEITLLSFPLHDGARWIVLDDPRFTRTVVAHERVIAPLGVFAAWKLRGNSELFGPDDRLHLWYSNVGLVRLRFHVVGNAVDNTGNVIGTVETDSDMSLSALQLERPHALADAPQP